MKERETTRVRECVFQGKTLWLVELFGKVGEGPLMERVSDYVDFLPESSYAHCADGEVHRLGKKVGDASDLAFTGVEQEVTPSAEGYARAREFVMEQVLEQLPKELRKLVTQAFQEKEQH